MPKTPSPLSNNPPPLKKEEPALYRHAVKVYEAMYNEAIVETVEDERIRVFRGYTGDVLTAAKISHQYQGPVMQLLERFECIVVVARGMRNSPACIALIRHPDDAAVPDDAKRLPRSRPEHLTRTHEADKLLSQRVDNLAQQLGGVSLVDLVTTIKQLDERLTKLEQQTQVNGR